MNNALKARIAELEAKLAKAEATLEFCATGNQQAILQARAALAELKETKENTQ